MGEQAELQAAKDARQRSKKYDPDQLELDLDGKAEKAMQSYVHDPNEDLSTPDERADSVNAVVTAVLATMGLTNLVTPAERSLIENTLINEGGQVESLIEDVLARRIDSIEARMDEETPVGETTMDDQPSEVGAEGTTEGSERADGETSESEQGTPERTEGSERDSEGDRERPQTTEEAFPDLVEGNHFHRTFKVTGKSSFLAQDKPLSAALSSLGLAHTKQFVGNAAKAIQKGLNTQLEVFLSKGKNRAVVLDDKADKGVLAYMNGLAANFAAKDADGNLSMDPKVVAAGTMALSEWLIKENNREAPRTSRKAVMEHFNLPDEAKVQSIHWQMLPYPRMQSVIEYMAKSMMDTLGVKPNSDAEVRFTQGMFNGLAASLLEEGEKLGWYKVVTDKFEPVSGKKWGHVILNTEENNAVAAVVDRKKDSDEKKAENQKLRETLKSAQKPVTDFLNENRKEMNPLTSQFVEEQEKARHVGTPPATKRNRSRIRQSLVKLFPLESKVAERLEKKANYLTPMVR